MKKEKKPLSRGPKILQVVILVIAVLIVEEAAGVGGYLLNYKRSFSKGNGGQYALDTIQEMADSPLEGMGIAFLGSSVTRGKRSKASLMCSGWSTSSARMPATTCLFANSPPTMPMTIARM